MATQLESILAHTRLEVAARRGAASPQDLAALERKAEARQPRGFAAGLRRAGAQGRPAILAELKKASPSRGVIRADFRPAELARGLEAAGAAALSVLTDTSYFQGSLANLEAASAVVRIPCLRKDFFVDPFQVLEARAAGADAILLIVAAHPDATLRALADEAARRELDVLWEVHDRAELARAVDLGAAVIGVNCRNLHTMEVLPVLQRELAQWLPRDAVRVAESGIRGGAQGAADIAELMRVGYQAFLVGESLMRAADPGAALAALLQGEADATAPLRQPANA